MLPNIIYRKIFSYVKIGDLKKYIFLSRSICGIIIDIHKNYFGPLPKVDFTDKEIKKQFQEYKKRYEYWISMPKDEKKKLCDALHFNPYG